MNDQINKHTAGKPVFPIMLMDCHYLLQQHLHLLTAVRDAEVRVQRSHSHALTLKLSVPLVGGQRLCEFGLFDLQVVQLVVELLDVACVFGQVLVDLQRQQCLVMLRS